MNRKSLGQFGEECVVRALQKRGIEIVARNVHTRYGELDIVARNVRKKGLESAFHIIEVKTRTTHTFGHAEEAITRRKLHNIIRSAIVAQEEGRLPPGTWTIDVALVWVTFKRGAPHKVSIRWIGNVPAQT